jgi:hypothetical protein
MLAQMVEDKQGVSEIEHIGVGIIALGQVAAALVVDCKSVTKLHGLEI